MSAATGCGRNQLQTAGCRLHCCHQPPAVPRRRAVRQQSIESVPVFMFTTSRARLRACTTLFWCVPSTIIEHVEATVCAVQLFRAEAHGFRERPRPFPGRSRRNGHALGRTTRMDLAWTDCSSPVCAWAVQGQLNIPVRTACVLFALPTVRH